MVEVTTGIGGHYSKGDRDIQSVCRVYEGVPVSFVANVGRGSAVVAPCRVSVRVQVRVMVRVRVRGRGRVRVRVSVVPQILATRQTC